MAGLGETMASGKRVAAAERQAEALRLRKAGLGFDRVAKQVGYASASGAHKAVMSALRATIREPADELRTLEVERLDAMLLGIWAKATQGDTWAIDRALKIMERRSALLGLDAPQKRELSGTLMLEGFAAKAALAAGLDPAQVMAEAERILAEAAA